jgi:capsular exopolysaccharide synthesis family protein
MSVSADARDQTPRQSAPHSGAEESARSAAFRYKPGGDRGGSDPRDVINPPLGHNSWHMSHSSGDYGRQGLRSASDDQSLVRYWIVLRERVWVIAACTVLVFLAAVAYVEVAPRTYQAEAEMEVQAAASGDTALSALPILHQTGDPTEDVLTGASLVTTQPVGAAVVRSLRLKMSPGSALGAVVATPVGETGLVAVQAEASSPQLAQRLANAFVDETIALSTARMHAAIAGELPTLQAQLAAVPRAQRYGAGTLGEQVQALEVLQHQNDPTLVNAAPALLPTAPSSPKTKLSLVAGLLGGLLVGIGAAFMFHALDPRVRREDQLRDRFGLPILARIPREPHTRPRPLLPSELSPGAHEGYRTLRTTMAARAPSAESRAFLVTGSAPSEGKSTTAMGLAAALAQGGARVILIEADLRKPTLAASLNLKDFNGIDRVMIGKVELSKAIVPVRIDGAPVRVLAAQSSEHGISGGLSFAVVRKLVNDAKALADFVVIDSAPLTEVIDALPFAQAADEVLIVVRLDQTRLNKLAELDDLLSQHGVTRMGLVLIGEHPMRGPQYAYGSGTGSGNGGSRPSVPRRPAIETERSGKGLLQG